MPVCYHIVIITVLDVFWEGMMMGFGISGASALPSKKKQNYILNKPSRYV